MPKLGASEVFEELMVGKRKSPIAVAAFLALFMLLAVFALPSARASGEPWTKSADRSKTTKVWAIGDVGEGALGQPVSDLVASMPMRYLLYLGDIYPAGSAADFANNYAPTFGQFDSRAVPTMGNHEYPDRLNGFDPYWQAARGTRPPRYYAFAASGWQVIVLNSEMDTYPGSAQYSWLKNLLKSTKARGNCRIALTHRPRYSGGSHGDNSSIEPLWGLLANRARIWLSGHDHDMQRFAANRGIVQFVSGAGGRGHYAVDDSSSASLQFSNDTLDGALRLNLQRRQHGRSRAGWAFRSAEDGTSLDSGSLGCKRKG